MTPEQLANIQARANAATRGPWEIKTEDRDTPSVWHDHEVAFSIGRCADCGVEAEYETPDAEFIANARTDVPALLAYARDLEARVGRVEAVTSRNALMDIIADAYGDKNQGHLSLAAADSIRAALTATDGAA